MHRASTERPLVLHTRVVTGTGGGPDKTILNSPRWLTQHGYDSVCAYLHPPDDPGFETLKKRAADHRAELISIPDRGLSDVSVARRLLQICQERNVSIWHGHDYKTDALGLLLKQFHPMQLVTTVHGWGVRSWKTPIYHAIDRASLRRHDRVICVSEDLLNQCLDAGVPVDRCSEIENAIDLTAYESLPDADHARREFNIPDGVPVIGAVGRLSSEKAFEVLIQAVDQLIESGTDAMLVIAGDGPERQSLEQLIQKTGRTDRIRLLGHVSDPRSLFAAMNAFVMTSRSEGLPNVLLESLACHVPVITTPVGGIPRVVTPDHDALFIPVDDPDALTVVLSRLLNNDSLQQQLARNGHDTVTQRYSFEVRMSKVAAVYNELLNRPASHVAGSEPVTHGEEPEEPTASDSNRGSNGTATTTLQRPRVLPQTQTKTTTVIRAELTSSPSAWEPYLAAKGHSAFYQRAEWLHVLQNGMQQTPVCLQAMQGSQLVGVLPLAFVSSQLFGRFLVSLPYLNSSGVIADTPEAATALIDRAIEFADRFDVRYLELRHEQPIEHPQLVEAVTDKVHMRLQLPETSELLWDSLKSKLRSQVRKPLNNPDLTVHWGQHELLDEFYDIFTRNMRDLGTPPFSRQLFESMLNEFPDAAEFCCVRLSGQPVASGLLIHGPGVTEVPSASSLRQFNSTSANMLMYWNLLTRAIERGQSVFDFGRSSKDAGTYRFKAQWGAEESPAVWQHYVRNGEANDMRPNSGKFDLMIRTWQKLPVWLTRLIGPSIVRGIP